MNYHLVNYSIVVLGDKHNPTIVNPDFLQIQEIVKKEWNWEPNTKDVMTIPPLARVPYKNGVLILVEPSKAQFSDFTTQNPPTSKIPAVVLKFTEVLKHVHYTAVGNNFSLIKEVGNPDNYLKEKYLNQGVSKKLGDLKTASLKLVFESSDALINLSVEPGIAKRGDEADDKIRPVLLVELNFHRDLTTYPAFKEIENHISKVDDDWKHCIRIIEEL